MGIGDFFSDVGDFGKSLFTGRWTGGEDSVGDVWNRDPLAVIAPIGALAGGAALGAGALGGAGLFGAEAAGGAAAAGTGEALAGTAGIDEFLMGTSAYGPQAATGVESTISMALQNPEITGAFASADTAAQPLGTMFPGTTETLTGEPFVGPISGGPATPGTAFDAGLSTAPDLTGTYGSVGPQPMNLGQVAGAPGAPPAAGGGGIGDFVGGIGKQAMANPLGTLGVVAAGGLAAKNIMGGDKMSAEENLLRNQAMGMSAQATQLMNYLQTGTLPPGLQAKLDQYKKSARTQAIAKAAKSGLSTDPRYNSALAQEFASIDVNAVVAQGQMADALLQTGMKEMGMSGTDLTNLIKFQHDNDKAIGESVVALAAAFGRAGGSSSLNRGSSRAA